MMAKIKRSSTKKGHSKNDDSSDLHSLIKTDLSKSHRHRIEKRKEKRKLKKIRRLAFNQKKPVGYLSKYMYEMCVCVCVRVLP